MSIEELKAKAEELGISYDEGTKEEDLQKAIDEKKSTSSEDDPEYYKSELKKVIAQRDREKSEKRKLQSKLSELETKMNDFPDADDYEKTKQAYNELLEFKKEVEKQKEEEELKNKTEFERAEIQYQKQMKEMEEKFQGEISKFQTALEEKETALREKEQRLQANRKISLEKDLLGFSAKYKACNPQQIVRLLSPDFTYDDQLEKWVVLKKDAKGKIIDELDANDYVKEFLSAEENSNLVQSDINSSGTNHQSNPSIKETKVRSNKYDTKSEDLKKEAELRGLTVEDYIQILELRDAKMERVKAGKS